jgi:hypothetical protein
MKEDEGSDVLLENPNLIHDEFDVVARTIEEALSGLEVSIAASADAERHPERRARAAWNAFYERRLPEVKEVSKCKI